MGDEERRARQRAVRRAEETERHAEQDRERSAARRSRVLLGGFHRIRICGGGRQYLYTYNGTIEQTVQGGEPRPGWGSTVRAQGMVFGTPARGADGAQRPYWNESAHYSFTMDEVLSLEADVEVLHAVCLDAVDH